MPQFDISTYYSQIFWLIIIFASLYVLVAKFITPQAEKIFSKRTITIKDNIAEAEELSLKIKKLNEYYNTEIKRISSDLENIQKERINTLESDFLAKKIALREELKQKFTENLKEMKLETKLFWKNEGETVKEVAEAVIKKINGVTIR